MIGLLALCVISVFGSLAFAGQLPESSALTGDVAERFLATATIVNREKIEVGVTEPDKLTLTDGVLTLQAVWKTVEEFSPRQKMSDGQLQLAFRDSFRSEIAAYKLSLMLGLDFVPPTISRVIDGEQGSLQLWMQDCITENERKKQGLHAPDREAWNRQIATVRLFHQLIHDTDFNNVTNILITPDFRVWVIDSSRGFYLDTELRNPDALRRFSRSLLEQLGELDTETLKRVLGEWLSGAQISALLKRRDRILELAERRIVDFGEEGVLFP